MDTPKKNQTGTAPLSKFEDSPVFSFINSLSPIKPLNSVHIAQTFNSLPSIFTSPHGEFKSPTRQKRSDPAKSASSFEDGTTTSATEAIVTVTEEISVTGVHNEDPNSTENVKFDRYSACSVPIAEECSEKILMEDDGNVDGAAPALEWETSISDPTELLIFSSPIISGAVELIQKPNQKTGFSTSYMSHSDRIDDNPISEFHRGIRRRCLDFKTAGTTERTADDDQKPASLPYSGRCALPGIGLHLNALSTRFKDQKHSNSENLSSERPLNDSFNSTEEPLLSSEKEVGIDNNDAHPKKNRQWTENAGNFGSCKRCNCKKSRCLKLYCECFAAGVYCIEPCSCQECFNKPIHEDVVLETRKQIESRNPLAFAPKVIVNSDPVSELGDDPNKTPASARHKRGCNCKKSSCLKKYCECYQGGVGCSENCRCEGCKNAFGRKDESALIGTETEEEEEEEEEEGRRICQEIAEMRNDSDQKNSNCAAPSTPLGSRRSLIPLPFQLKRKLPSSAVDDRSCSRLSVRFKLEERSIIQTQPKIEKGEHDTCEEKETQEIPCTDCSSGVKTVSPNSKRVILPPPPCDFGPSPSARIGRKLILQSVPSFPSLTPQISRVNGPSKL